ncbi:MAG: aldehyde dehydrogenase family protein [Candidatus Omnitrophota bacterium]
MKHLGNFINGRFVRSSRGKRLVSEDPGDLDHPVGEIQYSERAVPEAVEAARSAFEKWSRLKPRSREQYLIRFQKALKQNEKALAFLITREMGKTLGESEAEVKRIFTKVDVARGYEPALVRETFHKMQSAISGVLRFRPRGVIAVLSPFNIPAHLAVSPAISALATGNTVVLKPSEITPFVGQFLAQLWREARLPKGVFNLVQGAGEVGEALVGHPDVDGILFTGSWRTGSKIREKVSKDPHKLCALEMGGKNAAIVLKDCDLDAAVSETVKGAYLTTGQRCNATSRILVEKPAAERFISLFLKKVDQISIGYGTEKGVFMGPVASRKGFDRIRSFIRRAPAEGFKVLRAGGVLEHEKKGYYLKPSVHLKEGAPRSAVKDGTYTDDEILGPDAAICVVKDLEEAIALNNRSRYGLVVSIFTRSRKNYETLLWQAQNGLVHWNVATVQSSSRLPFGGLKRSGNNRPAGFFAPYLCTIPTASLEKG